MLRGGAGRKKDKPLLTSAGATCLFEAGVPERVIQKRTGHQCLERVQKSF